MLDISYTMHDKPHPTESFIKMQVFFLSLNGSIELTITIVQ